MDHRRYLLQGSIDLETLNHACLANGDFDSAVISNRHGYIAVTVTVADYMRDESELAYSNLLEAFDRLDIEAVVDSRQPSEPARVKHTTKGDLFRTTELVPGIPNDVNEPDRYSPLMAQAAAFEAGSYQIWTALAVIGLLLVLLFSLLGWI
ncbi:MAG: hypothetical protein R3C03_24120 [Pirellulaceae bacterium]